MRVKCFQLILSVILLFVCSNVCAKNEAYPVQEYIKKTKVDGYLRSFYFTRDYSMPGTVNQSAFSLGGALNIQTAPIYHFSAGASYYAAEPLGLNSSDIEKVDVTLPGQSINVLGQAFLQYQNPVWLIRGGDQMIKTPWLNDSPSRMIPATYQAILLTVTPISNLDVTVFRQFRFKGWTSKSFDTTNLYEPGNFGAIAFPQLEGESVLGTLSTGAKYTQPNLIAQAWFYKFYDFANFIYADACYTFKNNTHINPIVAMQLGSEWGDGKNTLNTVGLGKANSAVYGALLGLEIYDGKITFAYDDIPQTAGAFENGNIVSPYTAGYTVDPLFTTSMIAGLIEKASGHAMKLTGCYSVLDKQLTLLLSYAKYYTRPALKNTNESDIDVTYSFNKTILKGLSLRNRLGILNNHPIFGRFIYNRVMLEYDFG